MKYEEGCVETTWDKARFDAELDLAYSESVILNRLQRQRTKTIPYATYCADFDTPEGWAMCEQDFSRAELKDYFSPDTKECGGEWYYEDSPFLGTLDDSYFAYDDESGYCLGFCYDGNELDYDREKQRLQEDFEEWVYDKSLEIWEEDLGQGCQRELSKMNRLTKRLPKERWRYRWHNQPLDDASRERDEIVWLLYLKLKALKDRNAVLRAQLKSLPRPLFVSRSYSIRTPRCSRAVRSAVASLGGGDDGGGGGDDGPGQSDPAKPRRLYLGVLFLDFDHRLFREPLRTFRAGKFVMSAYLTFSHAGVPPPVDSRRAQKTGTRSPAKLTECLHTKGRLENNPTYLYYSNPF